MSLVNDFFNNTAKPEGTLGKLMVGGMNSGHAALAAWGSQFVGVSPTARVLDVGCGGGGNICSYLMRCDGGRVDGIDYSEVSVNAAQQLNARAIDEGRCRIMCADVDAIPFDDGSYDLVTAFETIYFWPDLEHAFSEIARVLAPGGRFLVVNESTGTDATSQRYAQIIAKMRLHTPKQIRSIMEEAGFQDVVVHEAHGKPWISVVGTKPGEPVRTHLRSLGPDYRNWVPLGMVGGMAGGTAALVAGAVATHVKRAPKVLPALLGAGAVGCAAFTGWCVVARDRFSYSGGRKLSQQIVEGTASYVRVPDGGTCLDVGCGSGALSIAVARRNPQAKVIGVDRWGAEYSSYNQHLCEENAAAEGARNASFQQGDATALPFEDETFDAVTSNYVYHNVTGTNKQALLRETLRCLKKGGTFAIHDIMSPMRYGDMQAFRQELLDEGYRDVQLIPTDNGLFMGKVEAAAMMLTGSTLLVGTK